MTAVSAAFDDDFGDFVAATPEAPAATAEQLAVGAADPGGDPLGDLIELDTARPADVHLAAPSTQQQAPESAGAGELLDLTDLSMPAQPTGETAPTGAELLEGADLLGSAAPLALAPTVEDPFSGADLLGSAAPASSDPPAADPLSGADLLDFAPSAPAPAPAVPASVSIAGGDDAGGSPSANPADLLDFGGDAPPSQAPAITTDAGTLEAPVAAGGLLDDDFTSAPGPAVVAAQPGPAVASADPLGFDDDEFQGFVSSPGPANGTPPVLFADGVQSEAAQRRAEQREARARNVAAKAKPKLTVKEGGPPVAIPRHVEDEQEEEQPPTSREAERTPMEPIVLEEHDKKRVTVMLKGEKTPVSWYSDTAVDDVKMAILCACDAIMDGGFSLQEINDDEITEGRIFQYEEFGELRDGGNYILMPSAEREELKNITGDRWRRLKTEVEPLRHIESQKAIERMRRGSNLLKHTKYGFPHLRQFQLSDDLQRLVWYTGAKSKKDSLIQMNRLVRVELGQQTPVFQNYRLPMLEHLSFSLIHADNGREVSLDITCKDEFEFDHWVTGFKALLAMNREAWISKQDLLSHSKRFRKAIENNKQGIVLTALPEEKEKGDVALDDCIEIVAHTPRQLKVKMDKLRERLKAAATNVEGMGIHDTGKTEVWGEGTDLSTELGMGPAYAVVFDDAEDAQDLEMETRRMTELVKGVDQILHDATAKIQTMDSPAPANGNRVQDEEVRRKQNCRQIDQLLWKAEVDLENVEDMYERFTTNNKGTATGVIAAQLAELGLPTMSISEAIEAMTPTTSWEDVKGWFS